MHLSASIYTGFCSFSLWPCTNSISHNAYIFFLFFVPYWIAINENGRGWGSVLSQYYFCTKSPRLDIILMSPVPETKLIDTFSCLLHLTVIHSQTMIISKPPLQIKQRKKCVHSFPFFFFLIVMHIESSQKLRIFLSKVK